MVELSDQQRGASYEPPYGDLVELNTARTILDGVGEHVLRVIAGEHLDLLETSSAVYEANGDYALGIFSSGWCRLLDAASRALCGTEDNREALDGGKWLCHESCWTRASKESIETGGPVDIECDGRIRLYAVPIHAGGEVVGSINVGYGDPPKDAEVVNELAEKFHVDPDAIRAEAEAYVPRSPFVIEAAKRRVRASAWLIGEIVERQRTEQELERVAKELERTNKELEGFAYSVSHDLRAPLRAVNGFSRILEEDHAEGLGDEGRHYVARVRDAAERMEALIDGLLTFSRTRQAEIHRTTVDVAALASAVFRESAQAVPERRVSLQLGPMPSASADPLLLRQVLANLISNAVKFTRSRPEAVIEAWGEEGPGERVFHIRDNGTGFDMRYADKLFIPFERLHSVGEFEGTGVGLALVQRIVHRHGGRVWAEAEPDRGATFHFALPEVRPGPPGSPSSSGPDASVTSAGA